MSKSDIASAGIDAVCHDVAVNAATFIRCACPERVSDLLRERASERRGKPIA